MSRRGKRSRARLPDGMSDAKRDLERDGIKIAELRTYLDDVIEGFRDQARREERAKNRPVPAASLSARRQIPARIEKFAADLKTWLEGYRCPEDTYLKLQHHWLKKGDIPPIENLGPGPPHLRKPRPVRLRITDIPKVLTALAALMPEGNPPDPEYDGGPDYVDLAEGALIDFVRTQSRSHRPHFRELAEILTSRVETDACGLNSVSRAVDEDSLKMRDLRRRKAYAMEDAWLAARLRRPATVEETETYAQLANALKTMKR